MHRSIGRRPSRWSGRRGWLGWLAVTLLLLGGLAPLAAAARGSRPQVVGGAPVKQGALPFMAFLEASDANGALFNCGGTLIAPRFVLTAAHCTQLVGEPVLPPSAFWIGIGQVNEGKFKAKNAFGVVAVTQDPGWNPQPDAEGNITDFRYDVAILELDRDVPRKLAQPIAVVAGGDGEFDGAGQPIVVSGWGLTSDRGQPSTRLRAANIDVASDADCDALHFVVFDPATMICAGMPGRSSCQGDSGGPIFAHAADRQPVEIGIASWSDDPCDASINGFVRLSNPDINAFITQVAGVAGARSGKHRGAR
ncbi:MAG TPA: serine protease [Thermomicrobiales bacterium]|nr:serine protease [Thermomicrobiales bacterium]